MAVNFKSANIISFQIALSGISPNAIPSRSDKKQIEGYVHNLLRMIQEEDTKESSFSLYDRVRLQAAKSKFEQLRATDVFEEFSGPNELFFAINQLFSHRKLEEVMSAGCLDLSCNEQAKKILLSCIEICLNPVFSQDLRNSSQLIIEKALLSNPVIFIDALKGLSEDFRHMATYLELVYGIAKQEKIPPAVREKIVYSIMEALKSDGGIEKRNTILHFMDPVIRDQFLGDHIRFLVSSLSDKSEEEAVNTYEEIFRVCHLGNMEPSSELYALRKSVSCMEWSALLLCVKEFTLDPKELAELIQLTYIGQPQIKKLTGFYKLFKILRTKKEIPLIWKARDYLHEDVARQLFGAMFFLSIDEKQNMHSVFQLLFSGYGCIEEELSESALEFESVIREFKYFDLQFPYFLHSLAPYLKDSLDTPHVVETFTKLIDKCNIQESKKQALFFIICQYFRVYHTKSFTETIKLLDSQWARRLLTDKVYDYELSAVPIEEWSQSSTLTIQECFMMHSQHPGFLSTYLKGKDDPFLEDFVRESLTFSRGISRGDKIIYFNQIPEFSRIVNVIVIDLIREGNLDEAAEIFILLDKHSRETIGDPIFFGFIDREDYLGAEKIIKVIWREESERHDFLVELNSICLSKNLFEIAERIYLSVTDSGVKLRIFGEIFRTFLLKNDIASALRINAKQPALSDRSNGNLNIVKEYIKMGEFKKGKDLAILMEEETQYEYRYRAFILLISKYITLGDLITVEGLLWCLGKGGYAERARAQFTDRMNSCRDLPTPFSRLECRMKLQQPIDERQLKLIYFALGHEKWREAIDGKDQKHGSEVYDKGLHGGNAEPGFMQSMEMAFAFVGDHLTEATTVEFYLNLHRVVCGHFKGKETHTLMGEDGIGVFRDSPQGVKWAGLENSYVISDEARKTFESLKLGVISEKTMLYQTMAAAEVKMLFTWFLQEYYEEIIEAKTAREKLSAIGKFTQRCEWLHPPRDGCGRTDTLILNKHLTENGFHPVILEYPYKSSTLPLDQWIDYLESGLKKWEEIQSSL